MFYRSLYCFAILRINIIYNYRIQIQIDTLITILRFQSHDAAVSNDSEGTDIRVKVQQITISITVFSCIGDNYYKRVYFALWNIIMV